MNCESQNYACSELILILQLLVTTKPSEEHSKILAETDTM